MGTFQKCKLVQFIGVLGRHVIVHGRQKFGLDPRQILEQFGIEHVWGTKDGLTLVCQFGKFLIELLQLFRSVVIGVVAINLIYHVVINLICTIV